VWKKTKERTEELIKEGRPQMYIGMIENIQNSNGSETMSASLTAVTGRKMIPPSHLNKVNLNNGHQ